MSLRRVVNGVSLLCMAAWLTVAAVASEYHGQVTFSGLPLPGSTVTVTATQGDKKATAISDNQGVFAFPDLADGAWTITIEMTGFAPLKQQVTIAPAAPAATFELKLLSLDEIRAEDKPVKVDTTQLATTSAVSAPSATVLSADNAAPAKGTAAGKLPAANPAAPEPSSQQPSDGLLINGSVSNAATSQYSMNQAFGNRRSGRSLYNGGAVLRLENSALDAAPFSVTGTPEAKQQFNNYSVGLNFGGPLNIKRLMPRGPNFGIFYNHAQTNNYNTQTATIPTGLDSSGNWNLSAGPIFVPSYLGMFASAQCNAALPTATQVDAATGKRVFTNNVIPQACVAPSANALLGPYPTPNVVNTSGYNYQLPLNDSTALDTLTVTMNRGFGSKNYLNGRWNFSDSRGTTPSIFRFVDGSNFVDANSTLSTGGNVTWGYSFTRRLRSSLTYTFSRSRSQLNPTYANKNDIEGPSAANISGADTSPAYWGPPTLSFSSGITGLSDGIFSYNRNETNSITEDMSWNRMRHTVKFGGGFSRLEFNYLTQSNPDGALSFTGAATQATVGTGSAAKVIGGSDFADFLLGLPDTSRIAYGNAEKYLRQSTFFLYVNDDYRVSSQLSLSAGVRWEYGSPVSERNGNLVNLDLGQNFSQATPVTGRNPLLHPDYSRPEPNVSLAWKPISGSSLTIRSGYQINNDTSVYHSPAYAMAQQAPLSTSLSISNGANCPFSISSPFAANSCTTTTADSFAIDPNFRVGYVQNWNLQVQRDLPYSMIMVVTYNGIKGTRGVQEFLPNTCAPLIPGGPTTCGTLPAGYIYRTSNGNSTHQAGSIELHRRLRNGFAASLLYTYAKSLDDDYSLGAQGGVTNGSGIAQDWTDLHGQRGLSTTDQRNLLNLTAQYTTGMGLGGRTFMSGWRGAIYKEWTIQTSFNVGSGLPETPIYGGATVGGAAINGTIRPNLVGSPTANLAPGYFVNTAAFAQPAQGTFGNARRDSIEGPNTFSLNAGMNRTFRLHGRYSMDAQVVATNVLNHVVYTGWNTVWTPTPIPTPGVTIPKPTFGAPFSANQMRTVSVQFRMRF